MTISRINKRLVILGIILSLISGFYSWSSEQARNNSSATSFADQNQRNCHNEHILNGTTDNDCEAARPNFLAEWHSLGHDRFDELIAACLPIPIVWIGGFILVYVVRIMVTGCRAVLPWKAMDWPKRIVLIACAALFSFGVVFGALVICNLLTDIEVPATPTLKSVATAGPDYLNAKGTWTRTDLIGDSIASPLQTSDIVCQRSSGTCIEATASLDNHVLFSDQRELTIKTWTTDVLVAEYEEQCSTEVITIDIKAESITGAARSTHQNEIYCQMYKSPKPTWTYEMKSGLEIHEQLRRAATTRFQRIMYSLAGN